MKNITRRNLVIHAAFFVVIICLAGLVYYAGGQMGKAFGSKGFIGVSYDERLIITRVLPNSPAEDVGLKPGDRIVSFSEKWYNSDVMKTASYTFDLSGFIAGLVFATIALPALYFLWLRTRGC